MAKAVMETAAERIRRRKQERLADKPAFDFTAPGGDVYKLRRPSVAEYIHSGVMPVDLASKLAKSAKTAATQGDVLAALDTDEQIRFIEFKKAVVMYCSVDPKIVEQVTHPSELAYSELDIEDATAIFEWAVLPGGAEAAGLENFPQEG